ncbi:hypothetical protein ACQPW3_26060 [Actinosynnema sp. CA-248983]
MEQGLSGLAGALGLRATFIGFLPAGTLVVFVGALLAAGPPDRAPVVSRLLDRAAELSVAESGVVLLGLVVVTVLTQPLQLPLVQLFEGYRAPGPVGRLGRKRQLKRRSRLDRERQVVVPRRDVGENTEGVPTRARQQAAYEAAWRLARRYPPAGLVLPTALGNVLRAAEYRAGAPYGLDSVTAWPRLYPLLSESARAVSDDRRLQLDVAVRFSASFVLAAVASAVLLWRHGWWLVVPVGVWLWRSCRTRPPWPRRWPMARASRRPSTCTTWTC